MVGCDAMHLGPCFFSLWGGAEHIVLPKRSRWLVTPELLLDRCVQLTRVVFASIDKHHQYS